MLSQLTKTIKLALKSSEEERAILRARSAVQRFPVVEWRQRLEDFQRRSINTSRSNAGEHAWGYDQIGQLPGGGLYSHDMGSTATLQGGFGRPGTPDSIASATSPMPGDRPLSAMSAMSATSATSAMSTSSPGPDGRTSYFENNNQLSAGAAYHDRFGNGNGKDKRNTNRTSAESFHDEDSNAQPLHYEDKRRSESRPKFFNGYEDDEASLHNSSDHGDPSQSSHSRDPAAAGSYDNFLAAANKQFSKQSGGRNMPDPYFDNRQSVDGNFAPTRPFTMHSRMSSFDSISSIVDEKGASSPLNKAMDSFTDSDGEVAQSFVQKLRDLSADNSKGDLCIEKFLIKSEKAFFEEVKKEKFSGEYNNQSATNQLLWMYQS